MMCQGTLLPALQIVIGGRRGHVWQQQLPSPVQRAGAGELLFTDTQEQGLQLSYRC